MIAGLCQHAHDQTYIQTYWGPVMFSTTLRRVALAITVACVPASNAFAHCFVGGRFFPATLVTDDPCVADEMSLPTVDYFPTAGIGAPAVKEVDVEADISKRITADFDVDIQYTWTPDPHARRPDPGRVLRSGDHVPVPAPQICAG
jgi:hypothetical protein